MSQDWLWFVTIAGVSFWCFSFIHLCSYVVILSNKKCTWLCLANCFHEFWIIWLPWCIHAFGVKIHLFILQKSLRGVTLSFHDLDAMRVYPKKKCSWCLGINCERIVSIPCAPIINQRWDRDFRGWKGWPKVDQELQVVLASLLKLMTMCVAQ